MKKKILIVGIIILTISGCVSYPKAKQDHEFCKVVTKELEIKSNNELLSGFDGPKKCDNEACLAIAAPIIVVSAGSYVVSGSIVIVGNTIHWLELTSQCPEEEWIFDPASQIKQDISKYLKGMMSV